MTGTARPRAKAALDLGSRVQRQEQRAGLGPLMKLRVAPKTRRRYVQPYGRFCAFVTCMALWITSFEALDEAVAAYIEELWESGDPKLWCNDVLAALHHYLQAPSVDCSSAGRCTALGRKAKCRAGLVP